MRLPLQILARRAAVVALLGWFLLLPLTDILRYPDRVSVLPNLETDAAAYDQSARDLARTGALTSLDPKHPPGWIAMLAAVYALVGHSFVAGKMMSWAALVLTVWLCAAIARRVFGGVAAIIAAVLTASSPGLRAYVGTLQYEVVTAALFASFLLLSIRTTEASTPPEATRRAVLAGLAGAVLVLTRETFVLVVPLAAWWIWRTAPMGDEVSRRKAWRPTLAIATLLVAVAAAPAVIWSAVQTAQHRRPILISDKAREVFDAGNNPRANGTYNEPLVGIGEPAGFAYIREHPGNTIYLAVRKLLYSFGVLRDGWNVPHALSVWIWRATTGVVPLNAIDPIVRGGWLMFACAMALWLLGRSGLTRWWVLPATCAAILLLHMITLASYRFAVPLLPIFYVLASGPLAVLTRRLVPVLRAPAVAVAVAGMLLITTAAQFQTWPLSVTYDAADLEGLAAANERDPISGTVARVADAAAGERPVVLLPDTYLPRGNVRVTTRIRRLQDGTADGKLAARMMMIPVDGVVACAANISAAELDATQFTDVAALCKLPRDGPVTLAVFSLGTVDLAVDTVRLEWTGGTKN